MLLHLHPRGRQQPIRVVRRHPGRGRKLARFGHTVVAPEYLLKSRVFGSTRIGTPAARAARMIAAHTAPVSAPLA